MSNANSFSGFNPNASQFRPADRRTFSLATIFAACGAFLLTIGALLIVSGIYKVEKLRIGGDLYARIIDGKDLVADVLPPPLFVIEPYLQAYILRANPAAIVEVRQQIAAERKDYDTRLSYWEKSNLSPEIKAALLEASRKSADIIWKELEQTFLPAIEKKDEKEIAASMARMEAMFKTHKESISRLVDKANAYLKDQEDAGATAGTQLIYLAALLSAIFVGSLVILWWLAKLLIVAPLSWLQQKTMALSQGDLSERGARNFRITQLADLAKALGVFQSQAIENRRMEQEAAEAARKAAEEEALRHAQDAATAEERTLVLRAITEAMANLAAKNLSYRITQTLPDAFHQLQLDFNHAAEQIEEAVLSVRTSTDALMSGTGEISTASDDLSRRTESQAASLEETAAALDEITSRVRTAADGAQNAKEVVEEAIHDAEESGRIVRRAVEAMSKIEKSSEEIGSIISVIDEIAFQTNLLALNAGVEAARAGDAGRGFAVVASEVRALAQRSAEAAKEIKALITMSNGEVGNGVTLVGQTGDSLERIIGQVAKISQVINQISGNAQEQSMALQEINSTVNQMDQMTQQNAAMAEQATAAAQSLTQESGRLVELVKQFNIRKAQSSGAMRGHTRPAVQNDNAARANAPAPRMKVAAAGRGSRAQNDEWVEF